MSFRSPLCHLPGRVLLPAAFGIPGQFPGSGPRASSDLWAPSTPTFFMLNLVYLVVDIEPRFCTGSPDCLFASPGGFFAARFASVLSSFSRAFPSFSPACSAFACAFWYLSFLLPAFSAEPSGSCALPVSCGSPASSSCPHAVRGTAFPAVLVKLTAFGLRAIMARRAVLSGILVLKPQTPGWCGEGPSRSAGPGRLPPVSSVGPGL